MSLDVKLLTEVYSANITHNLGKMAEEAGIYKALWRPEEIDCYYARDLIEILSEGLVKLTADPDHYKKFDSQNGWGMYTHFVPFVSKYLSACIANPDASLYVSR
jgi:hypothetical protein